MELPCYLLAQLPASLNREAGQFGWIDLLDGFPSMVPLDANLCERSEQRFVRSFSKTFSCMVLYRRYSTGRRLLSVRVGISISLPHLPPPLLPLSHCLHLSLNHQCRLKPIAPAEDSAEGKVSITSCYAIYCSRNHTYGA